MAGGKITRITIGKCETEVEENFEGYYERLKMSAGKQNRFSAKTTNHGKPKKPKAGKHFIKGWWSTKKDGSDHITEALIGETVFFHIQTKDIPDGKPVYMSLFEDDEKRAKEETDQEKGSDRVKLFPKGIQDYSAKNESLYEIVKDSKIVKEVFLGEYFGWLASQEEDKVVELFFACNYNGENVELPTTFGDYLKVKGMPKIIFVNGHWNRIFNKIGMSPGAGGEDYWNFFTGDIKNYKSYADSYFGITSGEPYFIDGSSLWGGSESGEERKQRGYEFAKINFDQIVKGIGSNEIYLISHSEGGACSAGVAKYLLEKEIKIGESVLLSTDEGDEFTIEEKYDSYQIVAGFLSKDWISGKTIFHIDPVVMDNRISGVSKYGVFISNEGLTTIHGATISAQTFNLLKVLKKIQIREALNSKGDIVYETLPLDENWAKIDEYILYNKKVDFYPLFNSNIGGAYKQRQD